MCQHLRLGRAHFFCKLLDMCQHDPLVLQRDRAKPLLILVVLADRVDEGTAVESFLPEPALECGKIRVSLVSALPPPSSIAAMNHSRHCLPSLSSTACTRLVLEPNSL